MPLTLQAAITLITLTQVCEGDVQLDAFDCSLGLTNALLQAGGGVGEHDVGA